MEVRPIGVIRSAFPEKFGVPKQPGLAPLLRATLELHGEWAHETCLRGLEECSHLWVLFHFHLTGPLSGTTVRPPVLGGEKRMGIFATRTPHRPNPIGLSLVKIESIKMKDGVALIEVSGHDFVDQTPLIDVKPYVASYDKPATPTKHWTDSIEQKLCAVEWEESALKSLDQLKSTDLKAMIEQVISLDPRPRATKADAEFGMSFSGLNFRFKMQQDIFTITQVTKAASN